MLPDFQDIVVSVSSTTRSRRAGEREGWDYHFLSRDVFVRRIEEGEFLEWAEYGGNLYGTNEKEVRSDLRAGYDVILEIELQGARQIKAREPEAALILVAPPGLHELEERLRLRDTESEEAISRRMEHAREDMAELGGDFGRESGEFDYVIVNDDVERARDELRSAILDIRAHDPER